MLIESRILENEAEKFLLTLCDRDSKQWSRYGILQWDRTKDGIAAPCSLFLGHKHWYELYMAGQTHFLRTQNQSHRGLILEMITGLNQKRTNLSAKIATLVVKLINF